MEKIPDSVEQTVYRDRKTGGCMYEEDMVEELASRGIDPEDWEKYFERTCFTIETDMDPDRAYFHITPLEEGYYTQGRAGTSLEIAWRAEKGWFSPGTRVLVEDMNGNYKIFTNEGKEE